MNVQGGLTHTALESPGARAAERAASVALLPRHGSWDRGVEGPRRLALLSRTPASLLLEHTQSSQKVGRSLQLGKAWKKSQASSPGTVGKGAVGHLSTGGAGREHRSSHGPLSRETRQDAERSSRWPGSRGEHTRTLTHTHSHMYTHRCSHTHLHIHMACPHSCLHVHPTRSHTHAGSDLRKWASVLEA